MNLNQILNLVERRRATKRRGRGEGSGLGKSSGRGNKGAKSRSGWRRRYGYEGGQMPIARRVPKRGFSNVNFATRFDVVNVGTLEALFEEGSKVTRDVLVEKGGLSPRFERLKILGEGEIKKKLSVTADAASAEARKKIEAAGGSLTCLLPPRVIHKRPPDFKKGPQKAAGPKGQAEAKEKKGGEAPGKPAGAPPKEKKKEKKTETPEAKGVDKEKKDGKKGTEAKGGPKD